MATAITSQHQDLVDSLFFAIFRDNCFWGPLISCTDIFVDGDVPTAQTDGKSIKIGTSFVEENPKEVVKFAELHELYHIISKHVLRRGDRDMRIWNDLCCDPIINESIKKDFRNDSTVQCWDRAIYLEQLNEIVGLQLTHSELLDLTEEQLYDIVIDKLPENASWKSASGMEESSPDTNTDLENIRIDNIIKDCVQAGKGAGKIPGQFQDWEFVLVEPKVPWTTALLEFVTLTNQRDWTWRKFNKATMHTGLYLPSIAAEQGFNECVLALDVSGSMLYELNKMLSEALELIRSCIPYKVHLILWDEDVQAHIELDSGEEPDNITKVTWGGTTFGPVLEYLDENHIDPTFMVVFTDGYINMPEKQAKCPTAWCITKDGSDNKIDYGKIIKVD